MELEKVEDFKQIIEENPVIMVEFYASWCPPCKLERPIIEEYIENHPEAVFLYINTDVIKGFHREFNVYNVPTFLLYKNGEIIDRADDYIEYEELEEMFAKAYN